MNAVAVLRLPLVTSLMTTIDWPLLSQIGIFLRRLALLTKVLIKVPRLNPNRRVLARVKRLSHSQGAAFALFIPRH